MFFARRNALAVLLLVCAALCTLGAVLSARIVAHPAVEGLLAPAGHYDEGLADTLTRAARTYLIFVGAGAALFAVLVWAQGRFAVAHKYLALLLLSGLALRLACVFLFAGGPNARGFSIHFIETMNAGKNPYIADKLHYPPVHLAYLQAGNVIHKMTRLPLARAVRLPWVLFDLGAAYLVYLILRNRRTSPRTALFAAAVMALSPYVIATSSYDGSSDCAWIFWTLFALYMLERREDLAGMIVSALLLGVAIASKPIPVLAVPAFVLTRKSWRDGILYGLAAAAPTLLVTFSHFFYDNLGFYGHVFTYQGGYGIHGIPSFVKMLLKIDVWANVPSLHALAGFCESYGDHVWKAALVAAWLALAWRRPLTNQLVMTFAIVLTLSMRSFTNYWMWLLPFLLIDEDVLAAPYAVMTALYGLVVTPLFLYLNELGVRDLYLRELFGAPVWVLCAMAAASALARPDLFASIERAFASPGSRLFASFRSRELSLHQATGRVKRFVVRHRTLIVIIIFLVAFFVRVLYVIDNQAYVRPEYHENGMIARNLLAGNGYSGGAHLGPPATTAFMAPAYPLLLWGYFATFGESNPSALLAFQCMIGALSCVMVFLVALRATRRMEVAVLAGMLCALSYFLIQSCCWTNVPVYTTLVVLVLVWLIQGNREFPSLARDALIGALAGLGALIEPVVLSVFPFALLWMRWPKTFAWKRKCLSWAIAILCALVVISPWTVRNAIVFKKLVPIKSAWWYNFWRGNNPYATGGDRREKDKSSPQYLTTRQRIELGAARDEIERFDILRRWSFRWIADNPGKFLLLRVKSAVFFWTGQNVWHAYAWAPEHPVTAPLNLLLFFFAAAGAGVAITRKHRPMRLILIVLATFPIPYYLCHSDIQYRYRMPMDPFLILLGALAIVAALEGKHDDG